MTGKVLVLGGTGAIGVYLVPELLARGFKVDVTSRSGHSSDNKNLRYIQGGAQDLVFLRKILHAGKYDAIVDFMNYPTDVFSAHYNLLLKSCKQYVFLSSYRVFADTKVITEKSPRLLDVSTDDTYLRTIDYSLAKARQENLLHAASGKNWTIVRPAITYSTARFQFGTMEANTAVWRALQGVPVILPREMLSKTTTMTWAGDVARLTAKLVLNKKAYGEEFNVATAEHHTWAEVAKIYEEAIGLKVKPVGLDEYIEAMGGDLHNYMVKYDRMFNRIMDNTKVLRVTSEKQENFTSLRNGLLRELSKFKLDPRFRPIDYDRQARFDKLTGSKINLDKATPKDKSAYLEARFPLKAKARRIKHALKPRTRAKSLLRRVKHAVRPRTRLKVAARAVADKRKKRQFRQADGAIATLTGYFNYGNIVQRFALQEFLHQKGYKFVSYEREPLGVSGPEFHRFRNTAAFVRRYIWRKAFDPDDDFSAYIVGSDQVWRNWGYPDVKKDLGYYFFDFVQNPDAKLIAYAPSFGQDNVKDAMIGPEFVDFAQPLVKRFNAISVRENSAITIMRDTWGANARLVLDPTMLLTASDYGKIIKSSPHKLSTTKRLFAFIIVVNDSKNKIIEKVAIATNLQVEVFSPNKFEILPPVEQWLKNFRDAELVVTDSFHGTVFSIVNNTPFIVVENASSGITRLTSLLEQFGLSDRLVTENEASKFDFTRLKPINWKEVNKKLEILREDSGEWLIDALKTEPRPRGRQDSRRRKVG